MIEKPSDTAPLSFTTDAPSQMIEVPTAHITEWTLARYNKPEVELEMRLEYRFTHPASLLLYQKIDDSSQVLIGSTIGNRHYVLRHYPKPTFYGNESKL